MEQVLLLNISYEPLRIIHWQKAITLVWLNKVEILAEYEREIQSVRLRLQAPAVVRLLHAFKRRRLPVKFSRHNIYMRDRYTCQYCGARLTPQELTWDHVIPRFRGGSTDWHNIVTSCIFCNNRKGGRTPSEAGMQLMRRPCRPDWLPPVYTIPAPTVHHHPTWADYLY